MRAISQHQGEWEANLQGTLMAPASRARAVSAVLSFYRHCQGDLGSARWNPEESARPSVADGLSA
ncbi:hypothetical protein [Streptomyces sp. NBC_01361]|uniref:hypothetical protein n=1 Tax=Streptomyces sp. NBC_01361 TaxID=2903838 RepID=UPI002E30ADD2|nr:hypothetical protein [Streptomyces sp. NBC_01361]